MASSSSPPRTWRYNVFTSFHGPDVRKTFISHLRKQFNVNGISMFDDQGIERGQTITPALIQAIRESRIYIVVLSKNYASSSWCLDELLEIFKCKKDMGQIVMTVFCEVDPSEVRKQTGEFGIAFNETCARKTEEERPKWSQALNDVGNIAGEHLANWDSESEMIEKIARDVSNKLNNTISRDFEDMVGIEAHLQKMQSLLHLDYKDESMIVGICGPAGIGKTTIARALHSRFSSSFQLTCFMDNIRGSYGSVLDEYRLKLCLQEKLLSDILNISGIRIYHLGVVRERLGDKKVLVILDDVDDIQQLEALANKTNWFGPGSRVIVTTKDQEILEKHGINNTYHVDFPSNEDARNIFCRYAFSPSLTPYGFEKLVEKVIKLCSNLPLGLRVMGSSLRGKKKDEWKCILHRVENSLDQKIERVLRVGYENLHKDDQLLFLLVAFFFNYEDGDHVKAILGDSNLDVKLGLKNLKSKSLIQISTEGKIMMHKLLQQVGIEANQIQHHGKRQILSDTNEICDVLQNNYGDINVMGISFDISRLSNDVYISAGVLKRMYNLQFLSIYKTRCDTNVTVHIPDEMDFPTQLRLLHWEAYPGKCLPNTFRAENLVELNMGGYELEKLWEGSQPLTKLKKMNLNGCTLLKELPDLSVATNLERLDLGSCFSLVEIPSYIGNLHKLESLEMSFCINLQVVPAHFDLASLNSVDMIGCWQLRKLPDISTNITCLHISEELIGSIRLWSHLKVLHIRGNFNPDSLPDVAELLQKRRRTNIEKIPDCIKDVHGLEELQIYDCPKLTSLPELPRSVKILIVSTCESLETLISFPSDFSIEMFYFTNCLKLGEEAHRVITHQSRYARLPGRNIPAEFDHRAIGNSLTIPSDIKHPISSSLYSSKNCQLSPPQKASLLQLSTEILNQSRSSRMAAPSSSFSPPRTWRYRVFTSFHGLDIRKTFLSHLRKEFNSNQISIFDDQDIERSQTIAPALTQAIKESRISIVVLSKNYASSSWCLDELLEILKCKEAMGQIVMTVFYGVDPCDVRKQYGDFGIAFNEACARRTEEERRKWSRALNDVGNIAGENFLNWDNESEMIEKIARDVSNKLNAAVSKDFEAHLKKMQSLLHLDYEDEWLEKWLEKWFKDNILGNAKF